MKSEEEFIENSKNGDFQQSLEWSKVKELWNREVITFKDKDKNIVALMSILVRKIPLFGYFMYVPRGPIGEIKNIETMKYFKEEIDKLQKKYNAFVIIIEPNIKNDDETFKNNILSLGYKINNNGMNFSETIQARHNFRLNIKNKTEEEVFNNFSSKTRYNIRLAIKKGVVVKRVGKNGLDEFYKLMQITGQRDKFNIRRKEYFQIIMDSFKDKAEIYISYYNNIPLAGALMINYANKMTYLYGASSNEYRNFMPTYLLQWTMIKDSIELGCDIYDFRGIEMEQGKQGGLYRFKKGFGGSFVELIGEIYIPYKSIKYKLFKIARKVLCNIRHTKLNLKNFLQYHFKNKGE